MEDKNKNLPKVQSSLSILKKKEKKLVKELDHIKKNVQFGYEGGKKLAKKELIQQKLTELSKVRSLISDYENKEFSKKIKKIKLEKTILSRKAKHYLVSPKSLSIARRTSFYYAMKRNYLFNPYKTPEEIFTSYRNQLRTFLLGRFLNKYGSIKNIERKNPILSRIKDMINSSKLADIVSTQKGNIFGRFFGQVLDKSIEKWFPGKFGSTPRLIKAWIKRKMLYGESGMVKGGIKRLSYGGYQRVRKLGVTFSGASYLSKRRKIRTIRRGFRKGGGYRRFA